MKKMKQVTALILALILALAAGMVNPAGVLAEETGKSVYWSFDENAGTLTIGDSSETVPNGFEFTPAMQEQLYYTDAENYSLAPWYANNSSIKKIVITGTPLPASTKLWFFNMSAITEIDISQLDTRLVTDMSYMFYYCYALTKLTVGENFKTDNVTNMSNMFYYCAVLSDWSFLANFNTAKVTDMNYMFAYCYALDNPDFSAFNTESVTDMSGMFYYCYALTKLTVGENFKTDNVTNMSNMFYYCAVLSDWSFLANFNTAKVTDMNYMFAYCYALDNPDFSAFNTESVTDMSGMFVGCSGMETLDLSMFNTTNVENFSYTFYYCQALKSLDISNFHTGNATYMNGMFEECAVLSDLKLSKAFTTESVISTASMFSNCSALTSLDLSTFGNSPQLEETVDMFKNCTALEKLNLKNFATPACTNMAAMFKQCTALEVLDISALDTSSVEWMFHMFFYCSSLENLDISNFNTSNVKDMSNMFYHCSSLKDLDVSNFDTSNVSNMNSMFAFCTSLTELNLTGFRTEKIGTKNPTDSIYAMFRDCEKLETIYVNDGTDWNRPDDSYVFYNCPALKGGNNMVYDSGAIKGVYARVDGLNGDAGYFTVKEYTVDISANGNGTVTPAGKQICLAGKTVTATATPAAENYLDGWYADGKKVSEDATYTFTPKEDTILEAKFTQFTYPITLNCSVNGTASASASEAAMGTKINITATPNSGYEIEKITYTVAGGNEQDIIGAKSFTMPNAAVIVTVTFKAIPANNGDTVSAEQAAKEKAEAERRAAEEAEKARIAAEKAAQETANAAFVAGVNGTAAKNKVTVKWGKVKEADRYVIYAAYCGKKNKYKKIKTVKGKVTSYTIKKLNGKKLNPKKNVKVYVVAQKKNGKKYKTLFKTPTFHIAGAQNAEHTNVKKIKVKKSKFTLQAGKTAKIKPTAVLENKSKTPIDHVAKYRYVSANTAVVKVNKKGKLTATGKGKTIVYVYAPNGTAKAITVTVKQHR